MYDVPGKADDVSQELQDAWNNVIMPTFNGMAVNHPHPHASMVNKLVLYAQSWPHRQNFLRVSPRKVQ